MTNAFRHVDTKWADGVYVRWEMEELPDYTTRPEDYLFQDKNYIAEDQARLDAWKRGEWHFVFIRARADILVVRNGIGTKYSLTSAGVWGIESDSGADYLQTVFEDEKANLLADLKAMGTLPVVNL